MRATATLARRLTLSLVAMLAIFSVFAAISVGFTVRRELNEVMDDSLQQFARQAIPIVIDDLFRRDVQNQPIMLPEAIKNEHTPIFFQLRDATGKVLLHSRSAPAAPFSAALIDGFTSTDGLRVYTEGTVSKTIFFQVAQSEAGRRQELYEALLGLLVPLLLMLPVVGLAVWLVVRHLTRPVAVLRSEISGRHGSRLDPIKLEGMPSELADIGGSVNELMLRLESALSSEREFSANAAHELRTPLAGAIAQIDRLMVETLDQNVLHRAGQVRSTLKRLARLSDRLLQLARADAGLGAGSGVVDLGQATAIFVEEFRRIYPDRTFEFSGKSGGPQVAFEPDALAIILRNLLENAVRHSGPGPISIVIEVPATLIVSNASSHIALEKLSQLATRFERTRDLSEGSGLGLSIVARLVEQAGAVLSFDVRDVVGAKRFSTRIVFRQ